MDTRVTIIALYILLANNNSCRFNDSYLSRFKHLEYNFLFEGIINNSIYCDVIYIKNIDFSNKEMLLEIQEFALCYAKSHPNVSILDISCENKYPVDEFDPNSIKISIYLNREKNDLSIKEMYFYKKRKEIHIDYPIFRCESNCCPPRWW